MKAPISTPPGSDRSFSLDLPQPPRFSPRRIAILLSAIWLVVAGVLGWQYFHGTLHFPVQALGCLFLPFSVLRACQLFPRSWVLSWWLAAAGHIFWLAWSLPHLFLGVVMAGIFALPTLGLSLLLLLGPLYMIGTTLLCLCAASAETRLWKARRISS